MQVVSVVREFFLKKNYNKKYSVLCDRGDNNLFKIKLKIICLTEQNVKSVWQALLIFHTKFPVNFKNRYCYRVRHVKLV